MSLEEIEQLRIKCASRQKIIKIGGFIFGFLILLPFIILDIFLCFFSQKGNFIFLIDGIISLVVVLSVLFLVLHFLSLKKLAEYNKAVKKYIYSNYPNYLISNGSYEEGFKIPEEYTNKIFGENNKLFTVMNTDAITGAFYGHMLISDIKVNYDISEGKGTSHYIIINGLWITCNLNKNFTCDLEIVSGIMLKNYLKVDNSYARVGIDNSRFSDMLCAYTSNREEVRSLFTSDFITALDNLLEKYKKNIIIVISNNQIHMAIDCNMNDKLDYTKPFDINNTIIYYQKKLEPILNFIKTIGG